VRSLQLECAAANDCLQREREAQAIHNRIDDDLGIDQEHIESLQGVQRTLAEVSSSILECILVAINEATNVLYFSSECTVLRCRPESNANY
jgi:hypothetical protein